MCCSDFTVFKSVVYVLFSVRGEKPGMNVQLTEIEIKGLCLKSREIFLSQPILLELEAPLKICGEYNIQHFTIYNNFLKNIFAPLTISDN